MRGAGCRRRAWSGLLPGLMRGRGAEPAATDIPAIDADVDTSEFLAAQLPQVLVVTIPATATRCGRAPASGRAGN
jgi:hypothetical protein